MRPIGALAFCWLALASAQAQPVTNSLQPVIAGQARTVGVSLTRPANTTAYAAGQAVCASTSADCVPLTFPTAGRPSSGGGLLPAWPGGGLIQGIQLTKNTTVAGSFTVMIYQAAPTIAGIHDGSTYSPTFADISAGKFRMAATCTAPTLVNGDNLHYQCTLANQTGTAAYVSDPSSQLYAVIQSTGAYTPGSAEVFYVSLNLLVD